MKTRPRLDRAPFGLPHIHPKIRMDPTAFITAIILASIPIIHRSARHTHQPPRNLLRKSIKQNTLKSCLPPSIYIPLIASHLLTCCLVAVVYRIASHSSLSLSLLLIFPPHLFHSYHTITLLFNYDTTIVMFF